MRARHSGIRPRRRGDVDGLAGRPPRRNQIAAQPLGVCEIGQQAGFGFQPGAPGPHEGQRLAEFVGRLGKSPGDHVGNRPACPGADADIGTAALLGQYAHALGMLLGETGMPWPHARST